MWIWKLQNEITKMPFDHLSGPIWAYQIKSNWRVYYNIGKLLMIVHDRALSSQI
jgi:hypothetical protein